VKLLVLVVLVVVALAPLHVTAQKQTPGPPPVSAVALPPPWPTWIEQLPAPLPPVVAPSVVAPSFQAETSRSAKRTILTAALVGTGTGLLIGLLLSGADLADDHTTVVLTWTAVGLTAGVIGGVITWWLEPGS